MSRRAWIIFVAVQGVAVACALMTPTVIMLTGHIRWYQVGTLMLNVFALWLTRYNYRRMRKLRREHIAREEGLQQRLVHARERCDPWDEQLTLALMAIWDITPTPKEEE